MRTFSAVVLALGGAIALGGIALQRHEPINALWIITAAVCIYLLGYRFYAAWIATRVLLVDPSRATPAERLNNGRDFLPPIGRSFSAIISRRSRGPGRWSVRHSRRSSVTCRERSGYSSARCSAAACRT